MNGLRESGVDPNILDQVKQNGIGKDIILEANIDENDEVRIVNLITYIFTQKLGFGVIIRLAEIFSKVEMLEQCGDFYKLRVPTEGKSIGWLFGWL